MFLRSRFFRRAGVPTLGGMCLCVLLVNLVVHWKQLQEGSADGEAPVPRRPAQVGPGQEGEVDANFRRRRGTSKNYDNDNNNNNGDENGNPNIDNHDKGEEKVYNEGYQQNNGDPAKFLINNGTNSMAAAATAAAADAAAVAAADAAAIAAAEAAAFAAAEAALAAAQAAEEEIEGFKTYFGRQFMPSPFDIVPQNSESVWLPPSPPNVEGTVVGDRILSQLKHTPTPKNTARRPKKTIYMPSGLGELPPGRRKFIESRCPVSECSLTADSHFAETADLRVLGGDAFFDTKPSKPPHQIWLLWLLESPVNTIAFRNLEGLINWTATYRSDSTIVTPYEKYVPYPCDDDVAILTTDTTSNVTSISQTSRHVTGVIARDVSIASSNSTQNDERSSYISGLGDLGRRLLELITYYDEERPEQEQQTSSQKTAVDKNAKQNNGNDIVHPIVSNLAVAHVEDVRNEILRQVPIVINNAEEPRAAEDKPSLNSAAKKGGDDEEEKEKQYYEEDLRRNSGNIAAGKTKMAAWFVSNCGANNRRWEYMQELRRYIPVDVYGDCSGDMRCARSQQQVCDQMISDEYKFYLSFENSNCEYYITEKFFRNALMNNVVPIVMGARRTDYQAVAPRRSFIHVEDFQSAAELAKYLIWLNATDSAYNAYFAWKSLGGQFIDTRFWCRLCAMIHDVDASRHVTWYDDIDAWWRHEGSCTKTRWDDQFGVKGSWIEMKKSSAQIIRPASASTT